MHVTPIPADQLTGHMAEIHASEQSERGYVPNHTRLFSLNPEAYDAWRALSHSIRRRMRLRRYELATLAAAAALGCRYCVSAHGAAVIEAGLFDRTQVESILRDRRTASLEPAEVAIMDFAADVARDASTMTAARVATLRSHGLTDAEIFDVALAAAARSFFSKALDSMGVEPDDALAATNDLLDIAGRDNHSKPSPVRRTTCA